MKQVTTTKRQAAGRWCTRALVVLGGAVAGTAVAWALNAGPATAEPAGADGDAHVVEAVSDTAGRTAEVAGDVRVSPVTDAAVAGLHDVTDGAAGLLDDVAGAGSNGPGAADRVPQPPPGIAGAGRPGHTGGPATDGAQPGRTEHADGQQQQAGNSRLPHAVVFDFAERGLLQPAARVLGAIEHVLHRPQDSREAVEEVLHQPAEIVEQVRQLLDPRTLDELPLPGLPGDRGGLRPDGSPTEDGSDPGTDVAFEADSAADAPPAESVPAGPASWQAQQYPGDAAASGGDQADRDGAVDAPLFPVFPGHAPFAPPALPAMPGGLVGATHADGLPSGVATGAFVSRDTNPAGIARPMYRHLPAEPGTQPGVTPD